MLLRSILRGVASSALFQGCAYLIIDEVHERDMNADFLLIVARAMLLLGQPMKLILMSATLQVDTFMNYFSELETKSVHIQGTLFPIRHIFLEEILHQTNHHGLSAGMAGGEEEEEADLASFQAQALVCDMCKQEVEEHAFVMHMALCMGEGVAEDEEIGEKEDLLSFQFQDYEPFENTKLDLSAPVLVPKASTGTSTQDNVLMAYQYSVQNERECEVDIDLVLSVLDRIYLQEPRLVPQHTQANACLVFLPGWAEIQGVLEAIQSHPRLNNPSKFVVLPLHSGVPVQDQRKVFKHYANANKIVLSTNIAETSLTIDDMVYVIDSGLAKEKSYDPFTGVSMLVPGYVSQSSVRQRSGRAGRCQEGVCFHLYSLARHQAMVPTQIPEMLRQPLEELCLQTKLLLQASTELFPSYSIAQFLALALDQPEPKAVQNALDMLFNMGCLYQDTESISNLGLSVGEISLDPRGAKLVLLAKMYGVLDPALTLAVGKDYRDPFLLPSRNAPFKSTKPKFAGMNGWMGVSDHVALLESFHGFKASKTKTSYVRHNQLSYSVLQALDRMRGQIQGNLKGGMGAITKTYPSAGLLKAIVTWSNFNNTALLREGARNMVSGREKGIKVHVSSALR